MKTKLSTYFISLTTAIVLISAVIPVLPAQGIINVPEIIEKVTDVVQINEAQAAQGGPSDFQLGIRDLGCSAQERTSYPIQYPSPPGTSPGYITDTNQKDPDCVRIKMEAGNTSLVNGAMYTSDFRLGIRLAESESGCTRDQGSIQWTPWASEGGGVSPTARPNTNVVAADCVWIFYQTRNHPNPAVRIENARTGISVGWGALAYTPWASAGGGWSNWSTTSNDFITARVALDVQLNYKYNADFVSTTIPQYPPSSIPVNSAVPSNIVMRNIPDVGATSAMPWSSDQIVSSSTDRGVSYCYQWTPSGPGQNCTQTTVYTSTKFKLRRIDGHIAAVETPAGDLEYRRTVVSNFTSYPQYAEICITEYPEHDGGGGEGPQLPGPIINDAGGTKFKNLVQRYLGIPKAQADHSILTCTIDEGTINGYYAGYQGQNQPQDVVTNQTADFPISVTGLIAGQYQLQFRMINTETGEMFGDPNAPGNSNTIARINVNVGQSWLLNCGVDQIVTQGEVATYMISATGNPGGSVSVTMSSNPAGPTMTNSPLVLSSAAYTGIANVATAGVAIGNYTLTFTGAVGGSTMQCPSNLTIVPDWGTVELFFDGSPGPTTPTPPEGDSGELTWTTQGSIDFCTPSMVQGDRKSVV